MAQQGSDPAEMLGCAVIVMVYILGVFTGLLMAWWVTWL